MKETKNVPQLRFSGFDDEWEEKNLGDIVTEFKNPVELPHNGYTRLGIRSHAKGTFHEYVAPGHELEAAQMSEVKADNLIMSITFAWEHAVAITDKNDEGKLVSQRFPQFRFNKGQVPKFYKYVIADEKFRHHLWLSSPGGAGRNRVLNIKESMEYKTSVPTTNVEQQKIGAFLSHVDSLIQAKTKKLESLKAVKKSLLQKCFPKAGEKVPEMRFAGFSGEWEEKKLGEICEINPSSILPKIFEYVDLESVLGSEMISHRTEFKGNAPSRAQRLAKKGDVFYQTVRPYQKNNYLFELDSTNYVFSTGYAQLRPNGINSKFLMCQIQSDTFVNKVLEKCTGTSYPAINSTELSEITLLVSNDFVEQQEIGQFFSKYDVLISAQQKEIDKLKDIKKSLLQKMFI